MLSHGLPISEAGAFRRYLYDHIETGGFLRAILENNLIRAVQRADHDNGMLLGEWANFVYWEMPHECHGDAEAVLKWLQSPPSDSKKS